MAQRNRKSRVWIPAAKVVVLRPSAATLADVTPLLTRVVEALGTNAAARLLGADRSQVSRWSAGKETISSEMGRRSGASEEGLGYGAVGTPAILKGSPSLPGSTRAIARFQLADAARVCNLDDAGQLEELGLRPSDVVTRDYVRSRVWARQIYEQ